MLFDAEYKAMLQPILDDPADDTARLIFADWLEEKCGEKEEAEFIRYGVEGRDGGPGWFKMPWAPQRDGSESIGIHAKRGFICEIHLSWESWLAEHQHWLEWYPIEKVKLTTRPEVDSTGDGFHYRLFGMDSVHLFELQNLSVADQVFPFTKALLKHYWPKIEFELPPEETLLGFPIRREQSQSEFEAQYYGTWPNVPSRNLGNRRIRFTPELRDALLALDARVDEALFAQMLHKEGDSERSQADTGDDNRST